MKLFMLWIGACVLVVSVPLVAQSQSGSSTDLGDSTIYRFDTFSGSRPDSMERDGRLYLASWRAGEG